MKQMPDVPRTSRTHSTMGPSGMTVWHTASNLRNISTMCESYRKKQCMGLSFKEKNKVRNFKEIGFNANSLQH
jgi:hypothetical protein